MGPDDLEPVELEPIDLDDEEVDRPAREPVRMRWTWVGVGLAIVAAWAAVAALARDSRSEATPPAPMTPTTRWVGIAGPAATSTRTVSVLLDALDDIGTGRFAAVVDERLLVLDTRRGVATPAEVLGYSPSIEATSGASLLIRRGTHYVALFDTRRLVLNELEAARLVLPAHTPNRWWVVDPAGNLKAVATGETRDVPDDLRLFADVGDGFLALAPEGFVIWSPVDGSRRPMRLEGALLESDGRIATRAGDCSDARCEIAIHDLSNMTVQTVPVPVIPEYAKFSPSHKRVALRSTRNEVLVVDLVDGHTAFHASAPPDRIASALSFSWTTNDELLIVRDNALEIWRGPDHPPQSIIGIPGLQQLVALP